MLGAAVPVLASSFFTPIFKSTLDSYPGLCFQVASALLLLPLGVLIWINCYTQLPDECVQHNNDRDS